MLNRDGFGVNPSCLTCGFRQSGFFCHLSPAELEDFNATKTITAHTSGRVLFAEQENPSGIYLICQGSVKLTVSSPEGKTVVVRIARPGEILGLSSVLSGAPYEATAATSEPCQAAFVSSRAFHAFLKEHAALYGRIAAQLGSEYRAACQQVRSLGLGMPVFKRLASFLLNHSLQERDCPGPVSFALPLSHDDIAEHLGTTRESVTRAMGEFRKRRLIRICRGMITIRDPVALQRVLSDADAPGWAMARPSHLRRFGLRSGNRLRRHPTDAARAMDLRGAGHSNVETSSLSITSNRLRGGVR